MKGKTFGQPVGRIEDAKLLTGRARFVDDIDAPGMLHAAFVRSSHAHAKIRSIDTSAAAAAPGVFAVLTLQDIEPLLKETRLITALPAPNIKLDLHRPILAQDEVVHVGEPIALVLAQDRYKAEDAATLVFVDYDPLPVVTDCEAALAPDSPVAHSWAEQNLVTELRLAYGDVDAAFSSAPHIYRERLSQHRGGSHSIECRGVVACYDELSDVLTMWSSTQTPLAARQFLCDLLGRGPDQVRVITPDVGGGFGPKLVFYPEEAAVSTAALLLKRPLKWIEDRREHFTATTQERDQIWDVEIAVDDEGRILGVRGRVVHDHGAYSARGTNVPYGSVAAMPLAYVIPAYCMDVKCVATNKVPVTPVRGAGQPQGVFAMERLMDRVARELNLDRAEVRRRNLVPPERMPYSTPLVTRGGMQVILDSGDYPRCQAMALEAIGWESFPERRAAARAQGKRLGLGLANSVEGTGRGPYEQVRVQVGTDGKIHVYTAAAAMGQGLHTMLAQVVAEQLGGNIDDVVVTAGDTARVSLGFGGFNSRQAVMAGSSAHKAAIKVREQLLAVAASVLKVPQQDLRIEGNAVVAPSGEKTDFGRLARASAGMAGFYLPAGTPGIEATEAVTIDLMAYANASAAVEVEVDDETGTVTLRHIVFAHDCGTVINPKMVEGQILGGIAHGIGNALFEHMAYDDNGQPLTTNLAEYLLVTATEMPPITLLHLESPSPLNELGIKGCGEAGVLPIPAAIASAIEDALSDYGVHIDRVPVSPVELLSKIEVARKSKLRDALPEKEGIPA